MKHEVWKMPKWMEKYRASINNTGGNTVEELMNDHTTTIDINMVLAMLCVAVQSQVRLLTVLRADKLID